MAKRKSNGTGNGYVPQGNADIFAVALRKAEKRYPNNGGQIFFERCVICGLPSPIALFTWHSSDLNMVFHSSLCQICFNHTETEEGIKAILANTLTTYHSNEVVTIKPTVYQIAETESPSNAAARAEFEADPLQWEAEAMAQ